MKRSYEIPVVFRVMPDEETQQAIDQVTAWIEHTPDGENVGNVTRIDRTRLGRRRLAYEIKGQRDGFYVLVYADIEASHLPELELNLRLYDPLLRYLIVKDEAHRGEVAAPVPQEMPSDFDEEDDDDSGEFESEDDASEENDD